MIVSCEWDDFRSYGFENGILFFSRFIFQWDSDEIDQRYPNKVGEKVSPYEALAQK